MSEEGVSAQTQLQGRHQSTSTSSFCIHTFGLTNFLSHTRLSDDQSNAQKAFQTVAAGQQAENLLNFDDPASPDESQPSGLAATSFAVASTPAAANLLSGHSSNPLDDLVSIFGNAGLASTPAPSAPALGGGPPSIALGGLGFGGGMPMSPAPPMTPSVLGTSTPVVAQRPQFQPPQPQPQQQATDDLLGLF